ncbi:hypothetical protein ACQKP0_21115 [Heyndrickxia sp. NPDC080065]|uniref:hypothetical protein n=1 Tax=Heyndrickxia sp. NPDC080065 TaxID=3390568 RepID=UPI003D01284C
MSIQTDINSYDRSLKKVEYDMEWNMERSQRVRNQLSKQIQKSYLKTNIIKKLFYLLTIGVSVSIFFLLLTNQLAGEESPVTLGSKKDNQQLYTMEMINGEETPVLTKKGMESIVYPMDAYKHIKTIVGEPHLIPVVQKDWAKEQLYVHAFYPTSSSGRWISVHYSLNESGSVEEGIDENGFLPDYPLDGHNVKEVNVAGQRAVLYEPTTDLGIAQLYIITKKYVYYLTNEGINEKKQDDSKELIQLANLFNFEAEK